MVLAKARLWFDALGIGWILTGVVALAGAALGNLISPAFYSIYLFYPFGPYFFLRGEVMFTLAVISVGLLFITLGIGLRRREKWSRVGNVLLMAATTLYFAALLIGLWGNYVKGGNPNLYWLAIPAIIWLAVTVPSLAFLLNKEAEHLFATAPVVPAPTPSAPAQSVMDHLPPQPEVLVAAGDREDSLRQ